MAKRFDSAHISELEALKPMGEDDITWRPVRQRFGIEAFGINAYTAAEAGRQIVEDHTEESEDGSGPGHQEIYFVATGRAAFTVDGNEIDAPAGTFVFIGDPAVRRGAKAAEPDTTVVAVGAEPGVAFQPSSWEWSFRATALRETHPDAARAIFDEALERFPEDAGVLYNRACFEARAGDPEAAVALLGRALELRPSAREWARSDEDFAGLRGRDDFEALL